GDSSLAFSGRLEGLGHVITNLTINRSTSYYVGLIGYMSRDGSVRHIGLEDVSVIGNLYVGGLMGYSAGTVDRVHVTGNVEGRSGVGGAVGWYHGTLTQSYAT